MNRLVSLAVGVLALGATATSFAQPRAISALGKATVQGQEVLVEVFVVVRPGQNGLEVARAAVRAQGAVPVAGEDFTTTGLVWDVLPVVQNYNLANEPTTLGGRGPGILQSTHVTWNSVATSFAEIVFGEATTRCPSLVAECPGAQTFDGWNDVGWLALTGSTTLAVTWFGTTIDEADMALNINFPWFDDGVSDFDAETVFLHENGHVLGLGHSPVEGAVMEPVYDGVRRTLHQDDEDAVACLYPIGDACACLEKRVPCTADAQCCSGNCAGNGRCAGGGGSEGGDCLPKNATCSVDGDCCSGKCKNGRCRG
jgi:Matrixin